MQSINNDFYIFNPNFDFAVDNVFSFFENGIASTPIPGGNFVVDNEGNLTVDNEGNFWVT